MKSRIAAAVIALALIASPSLLAAPASASTTPQVSASAARSYVKVPKAKPGQFCKAAHRGKYTKTKRYGTLKCVKKASRNRWKRA